MGKGTGVAKAQLDLQNQQTADQLAQQKAIRDKIMTSVGKYLSGSGEGFDPAMLSELKSQFLNQNTANFNQAGSQVISSLNARGAGGGALPVGGDFVRGIATLQGARATSQAQGTTGIDIENLKQALANRFNAASVASGQAAQVGNNVSTFNQGASNSLDQFIKAANAPGFLQSLATSLASGVGSGVGASLTGGFGAAMSGIGKSLGNIGKGGGPAPVPGSTGSSWG